MREDSLTPPPNHRSDARRPIGRRRALTTIAALAVATISIVPFARRWVARPKRAASRALPTSWDGADESAVLTRLSDVTGALFGHRLDERDVRDLAANLAFLARHDANARAQFVEAADYFDRQAVAHGEASYASASSDIRDSVVGQIMSVSTANRRSQLLSLISRDERIRGRLRSSLIPRLAKVYRASPPLWRRRGYERIPGESGDPRDYTRAGAPPVC